MTRPAAFVLAALVFTGSAGAFPLPPPLETGHLLGKGLPAGVPPVPLTDEYYALGWSPRNAFASMVRRGLPGGGGEVVFQVADLVTDEVLLRTVWPDWGDDQAGWWAAREAEADAAFRRFGLEPTTWQLGEFPLILDNEYYTAALRADRTGGLIVRLEAEIASTGRGLKAVWSAEGAWRWAAPLGFLASPYENRLALVLLVQPAGWAGKDQPLRFLVSGLSLKAGFPKP